jgi:hypothetical protein
MTLRDLQESWRTAIEHDGSYCPVCGRWGKIYARKINQTMARALIWLCLAEKNDEGWVDVPNTGPQWLVRSNQLPTLRWWELVERMPNRGVNKTKFSGMWRPTVQGYDFANGALSVPHKVFTYNGDVEAYGPEKVYIQQCLGDNFDYGVVLQTQFAHRNGKESNNGLFPKNN